MFKYVIFSDLQCNPHLRIFDGLHESHAEVRQTAPRGWTVLSAGEFRCDADSISMVKKSVSLKVPFSADGSVSDTKLAKSLYEAM